MLIKIGEVQREPFRSWKEGNKTDFCDKTKGNELWSWLFLGILISFSRSYFRVISPKFEILVSLSI